MTTIFGTFYWTGDLPDDDDVEIAPEPVFSRDFGEQWQYMAPEPVIRSLSEALKSDKTVSELHEPGPEDLGWYTSFVVAGWKWFLYVRWVPDGDHENCFEFDVTLCNNWWHWIFHRSVFHSRYAALGAALANALASAIGIESVAFNRRAM